MKSWVLRSLRDAGWAPFSVFVLYVVAAKGFDAYLRWPDLDMPTHFCGGLAITYFFATAIRLVQERLGPIPRVIQSLLALGLTALTAVVWEFLEFASDVCLGTKMNLGVSDTLSDLFFGLFGGAVAVIILARFRPRSPVSISPPR